MNVNRDIGNVLQNLSGAIDTQAAKQILQLDRPSHSNDGKSLHLRFAEWILPADLKENHIPSLLRAVKHIHEVAANENQKVLDDKITELFTRKFCLCALKSFQTTLEGFPENIQEALISDLVFLFNKENAKNNMRQNILQFINKLPAGERAPALKLVVLFIKEISSSTLSTRENVIQAIIEIPIVEVVSLLSLAAPLVKGNTDGIKIAEIIRAISKTPEPQRATLLADPLIQKYRSGRIIEAVHKIPENERSFKLPYIVSLTNEISERGTKESIIKVIADLLAQNGDSIVADIIFLTKRLNYKYDVEKRFIKAIEQIPSTDIYSTLSNIVSATRGYSIGSEIVDISRAITEIPDAERVSVVAIVVPLLKNIANSEQRANSIRAVTQISAEKRATLAPAVVPFVKSINNAEQRRIVINLIYRIPDTVRASILSEAACFTENMTDGKQIVSIIQAIAQIPAEERASFISTVTPLLQNERDLNKKVILFKMVSLFPSENRESTTSSLLSLFEKITHSPEQEKIFNSFFYLFHHLPHNLRIIALSHLLEEMPEAPVPFDFFSRRTVYIHAFLPLSCMLNMPLNDLIALSHTLKVNPEQAITKKGSEETLNIPELPTVSLNPLLDLFDTIDFTNREGRSKEQLKEKLASLLTRIANRENYVAVPRNQGMRDKWYQELHNTLAATLQLVNVKRSDGTLDRDNFESELIKLAEASSRCGSAWKNSAEIFYRVMADRIEAVENGGFENRVLLWLGRYKEGVIEKLLKEFRQKHQYSIGMEPHIYNHIVKTLLEERTGLSGNTLAAYDSTDKLVTDRDIPKGNILQAFSTYTTATKIFSHLATLALEEQGGTSLHWQLLLQELKVFAESKCGEELQAIEQKFDDLRATMGPKVFDEKRKQVEVKIAILEGREFESSMDNQATQQRILRTIQESTSPDTIKRELLDEYQEELNSLTAFSEEQILNLGNERAAEEIQGQKDGILMTFLLEKGLFTEEGKPTLAGVVELLVQKGFFSRVTPQENTLQVPAEILGL